MTLRIISAQTGSCMSICGRDSRARRSGRMLAIVWGKTRVHTKLSSSTDYARDAPVFCVFWVNATNKGRFGREGILKIISQRTTQSCNE